MTTLVARPPLQPLSMSNNQRPTRRLSARLQEKDDGHANGVRVATTSQSGQTNAGASRKGQDKSQDRPPANKKRKINYDEDDDGFMFTRAKDRKPRLSVPKVASIPEEPKPSRQPAVERTKQENDAAKTQEPPKKRRNKMSFSTPKDEQPVRRSKRLSDETQIHDNSPQPLVRKKRSDNASGAHKDARERRPPEVSRTPVSRLDSSEEHSATKISLPFADTPVIRKNKAMREGKSSKGERRSSLGLRGRRASSLIESGNSNALPHSEVQSADFYKHIESDGLPEPRRMRQLLTWCATRAMEELSSGTIAAQGGVEDKSARMAARVIQEELLKDFSNRSDMSDWFGREDDVPQPKATREPLPERPNPKNEQNQKMIAELEGRIKRLRTERRGLETLLHPANPSTSTSHSLPKPPHSSSTSHAHPSTLPSLDPNLLSPSDTAILNTLTAPPPPTSTRLHSLTSSLAPTIDAFATSVHRLAMYQDVGDRVAGQALGRVAQALEDREVGGRTRAREMLVGDGEGRRALKEGDRGWEDVLRGLSRVER